MEEKNREEILKQAKEIKNKFEVESIDNEEEDTMSFLDKFNKLVKTIVGDDTFSVYDALDRQTIEKWKKKRRFFNFFNKFKKYGYVVFLVAIIGFLITESVSFYTIDGLVTWKSWYKAILTEVSFIFLAAYKVSGKMEKFLVNILRGGVFILMLAVISYQTIELGIGKITTTSKIEEQIKFLEKQILEKDKEIKYYRDINWPRNATRAAIEKEKLTTQLNELKKKLILENRNTDMNKIETFKIVTKSVFRIIMVLLGAIVSRRVYSF